MLLPAELKSKSPAELEEWLLGAVEEDQLPVEPMAEVVRYLEELGEIQLAEGCAELLQETLSEHRLIDDLLRFLGQRVARHADAPAFAADCRRLALAALPERRGPAFVESVMPGAGSDVAEFLRRLAVLSRLDPGVFCHDKTWGFGVVRAVDDFYKKVTIDFRGKLGHQMSFAYAGEALQLVSDDHLYARHERTPEELALLVAEKPGEVVRIALRSYGDIDVPRLQEVLVPDVVPEADWKCFWEGARKSLKADPLVEMPRRRSDPIRLLQTRKEYGGEWFDYLAAETDPDTVLRLVAEIERTGKIAGLDDAARDILCRRLAYVAWACEGKQAHMVALAAMAVTRLGLEGLDVCDVRRYTEALLDPSAFLRATADLPAKDVPRFLSHLAAYDRTRTQELLLLHLNELHLNVLGDAVDMLGASGMGPDCMQAMRTLLEDRGADIRIIYWCCRHLETVRSEKVVELPELMFQVIDCLGTSYSGERLKARNQLQRLVDRRDWLGDMLGGFGGSELRTCVSRMRAAPGLGATARRSLLGDVVGLFPEMKEVVESGAPEGASGVGRGRFTSWRTHRLRQEQLRELVEEQIPANAREIARARSYGDLRENAEYKFAREHQGVLHRRRAELESDLGAVRGTNFAGFATGSAGMGTRVSIRRAEGAVEHHCILGEWDRDEALGIIPNRSKLAEALDGHVVGDTVALPTEHGEENCEITAVAALPDGIKAWAGGKV